MASRTALSRLLLDTHAWVWWLTRPERLSRRQRSAIERAHRAGGEQILISVISCWEVALLARREKLRFSIPIETWLAQATSVPGLEVVPLSLAIISTAVALDRLRDPAGQLVVATAIEHGARLVTSDVRMAEAGGVPAVR